jgi:hypothetical protein
MTHTHIYSLMKWIDDDYDPDEEKREEEKKPHLHFSSL